MVGMRRGFLVTAVTRNYDYNSLKGHLYVIDIYYVRSERQLASLLRAPMSSGHLK